MLFVKSVIGSRRCPGCWWQVPARRWASARRGAYEHGSQHLRQIGAAPAFAGGSIGTVAPQIGQPVGHIPAASVLRNEVGDIVTSLTGASRTLDAEHRELPLNVAENVVGGGQERGALQRIC